MTLTSARRLSSLNRAHNDGMHCHRSRRFTARERAVDDLLEQSAIAQQLDHLVSTLRVIVKKHVGNSTEMPRMNGIQTILRRKINMELCSRHVPKCPPKIEITESICRHVGVPNVTSPAGIAMSKAQPRRKKSLRCERMHLAGLNERAEKPRGVATHGIPKERNPLHTVAGDFGSQKFRDAFEPRSDAGKSAMVPGLMHVPEKKFVRRHIAREPEKFERRHADSEFDSTECDQHRPGPGTTFTHEAHRWILQTRVKRIGCWSPRCHGSIHLRKWKSRQ